MHWVYYFGRFVIHILVFPFASWRVTGREHVPERGPVLIVCNHLHVADPPIIAASIGLKTVIMAKEDLFRGWWSPFWVRNFGAFPVRRGAVDREALRQAEQWLKRGVSLIMFPEGKRSGNAQMQPALPGAALIASRLGVPILPVSIYGTEKLKNLKKRLFDRGAITVSIGEPFHLPPVNGRRDRAELARATHLMMTRVADLLPPEYRGVYRDGEKASD